ISFQPEDYSFINGVKVDLNNTKDVTSSKRILRKLKIAFEKRSREVKILKQHIAECKTPFVVMGDFNDTPASYTLAQMSKGLKNAFQEKGSGLAKTYNGAFPNFQIDYVLASPEFCVETYKIVKKDYSDHYPIKVSLSLTQ
ncbi:MAG TPA: endonuclease/exonuclease/phosphatase family protein, partial [Pelobium sp.]|nr:endonuclease/exonuclease/phosphatase family protein [Pelobium sp.]